MARTARRRPTGPGSGQARILRGTAVAAALLMAAACTSVTPAGNGSGAGATGAASSVAPSGDTFGSPAATGAVRKGGTLTVGLSADPDLLDPTQSRSLYSRYVFTNICEKLYDLDQTTKIVPQLATALPTTSADGRTVTIKLRTGVRFADGTTMDSAAVKASLQRDLTLPTSARKTELGPVTTIDTPDASTVVVHFSAPFAPFTAALADRAGMVLSPTALAKEGTKFASSPVCVGPFKFAARVPSTSISVVRDPNYYDAGRVNLDRIDYRIITDANIRDQNLQSGDVAVADSVSSQDVDKLRAAKDIQLLSSDSLGWQALQVNIGNTKGVGQPVGKVGTPLGSNPTVRRALELSIDRAGLVKTVFNGQAVPSCSPISSINQFAPADLLPCTTYQPEQAKKLLADAGVATPVPFTLTVTNSPDSLRFAQALQAMVKAGGFEMKIAPVEYTTLLDAEDTGNFQTLALGWSGRVDPDANITQFFASGGAQNTNGVSDKALDALLQRARTTTDPATRKQLYGRAVTRLQQIDAAIFLYRGRNLTGIRTDKVVGIQVYPDGVVRTAFAGLTK